jgi:hypothetical protein
MAKKHVPDVVDEREIEAGLQLRWRNGIVSTNFFIEKERSNLVLVEFDGQVLSYIEPWGDDSETGGPHETEG